LSPPDRARRKGAERRGRRAEAIAALWLQLKGYAVLGRRVRTPVGELDLIVRRGGHVAFVEVKARRRQADGYQAVTPASRRRIERASEHWLAHRPAYADLDLSFDLVIIAPWAAPIHVRDAWRPYDAL